jgi:hypothetical protein
LGLRLRDWPTDDFNIRDLLVIVKNTPPGSALARALEPDAQPHFLAQHQLQLARSVDHALRVLLWAKTKDGEKGRNYPEPYRFPWEPDPNPAIRGDVMTTDEADEFLGWGKLYAV